MLFCFYWIKAIARKWQNVGRRMWNMVQCAVLSYSKRYFIVTKSSNWIKRRKLYYIFIFWNQIIFRLFLKHSTAEFDPIKCLITITNSNLISNEWSPDFVANKYIVAESIFSSEQTVILLITSSNFRKLKYFLNFNLLSSE